MQEIFINASKYRDVETTQGTRAALKVLAEDIGSSGVILEGRSPEDSVEANRLYAKFEDVRAALPGSCITTLRGVGENNEEAEADLLENLLTPDDEFPSERENARLSVGTFAFRPDTIVKVNP